MRTLVAASTFVCLLLASVSSRADITVDYSNDSFFASNAAAKAALEAAVNDINAVLNLQLGAITNDVTTGVSGSTTLNFDFSYVYTNPTTGASTTINDTRLAANELKIFVGMRNLTGSTLGQGGPGGAGLSISGSGSALQDAANDAMAKDQHRRGDGPTISNLSGSIGGANFSFDVGPTIGNLWFDQDTNNDGVTDSAALLAQNWHFDHTTSVASGKSDFYSVALHETLHAIGFGTSDTWDSLVSGANWLGSQAILSNGTGVGLIDGDGAHIASGIQSLRLSDGMLQDAVMTPSITVGTRKTLTELDLAFLRDLGYTTSVPEPSSLAFLLMIGGIAGLNRRRSLIAA